MGLKSRNLALHIPTYVLIAVKKPLRGKIIRQINHKFRTSLKKICGPVLEKLYQALLAET